jgi:hypothetical protein
MQCFLTVGPPPLLHNSLTIKAAPAPPTVPPSYTTVPRPPPSPSYRPAAYHAARSEPRRRKILMRRVVDFASEAAAV